MSKIASCAARVRGGRWRATRLLAVAVTAIAYTAVGAFSLSSSAQAQIPGTNGQIVFTHWPCHQNGGTGCDAFESEDLYAVNPDGSNPRNITNFPCASACGNANAVQTAEHAAFSPDGRKIAYSDAALGVTIIDTNGNVLDHLPTASGDCYCEPGRIAWSPDGRKLVYENNDNLYLADLDTGDVSTLVGSSQFTSLFSRRLVTQRRADRVPGLGHATGTPIRSTRSSPTAPA